eukprot:GEMP01045482.1.p1 GENE.GEMP01045482.1~~GEMP01045482.1.p1  ORF type:complete len:264 (-),score=39.39 GEMP01045482.1:936-1727(-)
METTSNSSASVSHAEAMELVFGDVSAYTTAVNTETMLAKCLYHSGDKFGWIWMCVKIDASLEHVVSLTTEVDLLPQWHPVCKRAETTHRTKDRQVQLWMKSLPLGFMKSEVLVDAHISSENGMWVERFRPMGEDDALFPPTTSMNREYIDGATVLIPISENETYFVNCVKVIFPFSLSNFIVRTILPLAAKLIGNALRSQGKKIGTTPDSEWRIRISEDTNGYYSRAREVMVVGLRNRTEPVNMASLFFDQVATEPDAIKQCC